MPAPIAFMAASAVFSLFQGLMGAAAASNKASFERLRGRMLRREAMAAADRYAEEAKAFHSKQATAFTKAGVRLEGSPLAVLDETILVSRENISAIRAGARVEELDAGTRAANALNKGRTALISGIFGAGMSFAPAFGTGGAGAEAASRGGWDQRG